MNLRTSCLRPHVGAAAANICYVVDVRSPLPRGIDLVVGAFLVADDYLVIDTFLAMMSHTFVLDR